MRNDYTTYLIHADRYGEERKGHKYKAREWVKNGWRYIYDTASDKLSKLTKKGPTEEERRQMNQERFKSDMQNPKFREMQQKSANESRLYMERKQISDLRKKQEDLKKIKDNFENDMRNNSIFKEYAQRASSRDKLKYTKPENQEESTELTREEKILKDYNKKTSEMTGKEDMKMINPNYDPESWEYSNNCANCTAAFDLRRRGYDVEANPMDPNDPNTMETILDWYEGEELTDIWDYVNDLNAHGGRYKDGNGKTYEGTDALRQYMCDEILHAQEATGDTESNGHVIMYWADLDGDGKGDGGHDIAYYVEDDFVHFYDTQLNKEIDIVDYANYSAEMYWMRTDHLEINDSIKKTIKNR